MQWKNPDGSITEGVVIEDGGGNKISSFGGGSGSGGAVTVADGANVALGSTADAPGASTIIGQIKSAAASLAAILAKLIAGIPVTGVFWQSTQPVSGSVTANIGTTNGLALDASLQAILATLTAQIDISGSLWADPTLNPPVYYVRREAVAEATGVVTVSWWTPGGVAASPNVANLVSVSNARNIAPETVIYTATGAGTGYASGDILIHAFGIDTAAAAPALAYSLWMNAGPSVASGSILASAPTSGTYAQAIQPVSAAALPLPANAAQETGGNLASIAAALAGSLSVSDAQSKAFQGAVAMVVGTAQTAQRSVGVLATAAGNVAMTLADSSTITLPIVVGWQTLPFAATAINSSGTTATATYFNLK